MKFDMVFEGGGAKGMVFVGAMQVFLSQNHTYGRLLGTSAGAITAALLAAGYTTQEMTDALTEKQDGKPVFAGFMGMPAEPDKAAVQASEIRDVLRHIDLPFIPGSLEGKVDDMILDWLRTQPNFRHLYSFVELGGWFAADSFLAWLKRKLDSGTFNGKPRQFSAMRLEEFYQATQHDLSLIGSDTTGHEMLVLNHRTAPDLPVVWAVRMSMSIPLVWQEVVWQKEWGTYRGRDMTGHAIVDGGLLSNFPI
ncbi:MAG TPA: patatin-like phospholipase family protein, partial [Anaerolineae bacterium]